jgi:hypothetical protein
MAHEQRMHATGTSLESFEEAAANAFLEIPGDGPEGMASADIVRAWVSKGGVVGRTQYHVVLASPAEGSDPGY